MNSKTIERAALHAERFLTSVKAVERNVESDGTAFITGTKETAACRRISMDLTRALANLRRP